MGAIRQRRIARLLPRYGWQPTVICSAAPAAGSGAGVDYIHAPAPDLARWYRRFRKSHSSALGQTTSDFNLTSFINRWFLVPDKQAPWRKAAIRAGQSCLRDEKFDLIFASLEPRTNLRVAAQLANNSGLPCVMEYRDLWTGSPYHSLAQPTAMHRWLHQRLERQAVAAATRVTTVARELARYLERQYGDVIQGPIALNYNFFDPEEYPVRDERPNGPFILSYVGAMYMTRSPAVFFEGLRLFLDQHAVRPEQFRFRWIGSSFNIGDVEAALARLKLNDYVDRIGQVAHAEALRELVHSDAALIIQSPDDSVHIPGKLFEALGARVPVLALSHPCEVTEIINRTRAGLCVPHDPRSIADALAQLWSHRRAWNFDETERQRFSADQAIPQLASLFDDTCRAQN